MRVSKKLYYSRYDWSDAIRLGRRVVATERRCNIPLYVVEDEISTWT